MTYQWWQHLSSVSQSLMLKNKIHILFHCFRCRATRWKELRSPNNWSHLPSRNSRIRFCLSAKYDLCWANHSSNCSITSLRNTGSDYLLEVTERVTGTWAGAGEAGMANTFREMSHNVQRAHASPLSLNDPPISMLLCSGWSFQEVAWSPLTSSWLSVSIQISNEAY